MKAFLFDMDGTLVDNMDAHNHAWQAFLASHGINAPIDEMVGTITGKHNSEIVPYYWGDGLSDAEIKQLGDAKETFYRENYAEQIVPIAGVFNFLAAIKAAGHPTALCTSANSANMNFTLNLHLFRPYFDIVLCSDDVTHPKPDPEMYWTAANMLNVPVADCIVFEDSRSGIAAAANAGMEMVLLTTSLAAAVAAEHPHIRHAIVDYSTLDLKMLS